MSRVISLLVGAIVLFLFYGINIYNKIQVGDEDVKTAWTEVLNQYQRRADLTPNVVSSVKGYAAHEKEVLTEVVEARANATAVKITSEVLNDPAAFKQFTQAQSQLGSSLGRLLVTVERYPELRTNTLFKDLATQLEDTENRITVARTRYIRIVRDYNLMVRRFPGNILAGMMGYSTKASFVVDNEAEISTPPKVDFNSAPAS